MTTGTTPSTPLQRNIGILKDLTATLRDAFLFGLGVMLVVWPVQLNQILTSAGFEEGSFLGMKWKANLEKTDLALKDARARINDLEALLKQNEETLSKAIPQVADPAIRNEAQALTDKSQALREATRKLDANVASVIQKNADLVYSTTREPEEQSSLGYGVVYGGDTSLEAARDEINAAKQLSLPDTVIFLRNGSYRSVSRVPSLDKANEVLQLARRRRDDAYLVRLESWCPKQKAEDGYLSCQR